MNKKNFDQFIYYYAPTRAKSATSLGQKVETFTVYQKAFVAIEAYNGAEDIQNERVAWSNVYLFTGHYISAIDTTYRILYGTTYYAILDIETLNRNRWMRIRAEKIQS